VAKSATYPENAREAVYLLLDEGITDCEKGVQEAMKRWRFVVRESTYKVYRASYKKAVREGTYVPVVAPALATVKHELLKKVTAVCRAVGVEQVKAVLSMADEYGLAELWDTLALVEELLKIPAPKETPDGGNGP
jgi:hypothetical protein